MADQAEILRQVRLALQSENYPQAIIALQQAVGFARSVGDRAAEGRHLGNLALTHYRNKQPQEALECFELALVIARAEEDRLTEDGILGNMGNILREIGRFEDAIRHLNEALRIADEINDVRGRGIWLANLGLAYDDLNRYDIAIVHQKEAVSIARLMRDQRNLAARLSHLGYDYLHTHNTSEAVKCFHEVVAIYKTLGDPLEAAVRMNTIAGIYNDLGQKAPSEFEARFYYELARDAYNDTVGFARELNDRIAEGDILTSLGGVQGNLGEYQQAIQTFGEAHAIFSSLGMTDRLEYIEEQIQLARGLLKQQKR